MINGERRLGYWRWKTGKQFPTNLYSPMHGMVSAYQRPASGSLRVLKNGRTYHGMGQPLCGLVGDKVLTGSGAIGRLFSLSKSPETVKKVNYNEILTMITFFVGKSLENRRRIRIPNFA